MKAIYTLVTALGAMAAPSVLAQRSSVPAGDQLVGVWETDGYGWILDVSETEVRVFDTAPGVCVFNSTFPDSPSTLAQRHNASLNPSGDQLKFTLSDNVHQITARRIETLPGICDTKQIQDPQAVFEAFNGFLSEHYKLFDLYGVDWSKTVEEARATVTPDMKQSDLFELFTGMIADIEDARLTLRGNVDGSFRVFISRDYALGDAVERAKSEGQIPPDFDFANVHWQDNVIASVLNNQGAAVGNDLIQYGMVSDTTGYVAIRYLFGFAGSGINGAFRDAEPLNAALDQVIADLKDAGAKAVILDLSTNTGGTDEAASIIASRFAEEDFSAYSKQTLDFSGNARTDVTVPASARSRFEGPVYVLTSELTRGSAEVLTMAMRALPNVTHVGTSTNGAVAGVLEKVLPNGWVLGLSNEMYFDHNGNTWDGIGIEPDVTMDIFPVEKLTAGHPTAVATVVDLIADRSVVEQ